MKQRAQSNNSGEDWPYPGSSLCHHIPSFGAYFKGRLFASLLSVTSFLKIVQESLARLESIKETGAAERSILRKNDRRSAALIFIAFICQRLSNG
mgnify:CR=1 FL=1